MRLALLKTLVVAAGSILALGSSAAANCGGSLYCNSGSSVSSHSYPGLSSWSYGGGTSYGSAYGSSFTPASYGSSYTSNYSSGQSYVPFTTPSNTSVRNMTNLSIPGLGANERLCTVDCPVNVYNPEGGKVLGCYEICKPAVQTITTYNYVRVVRPIVYVHYPVPTPVYQRPVASCYGPAIYHGYFGC